MDGQDTKKAFAVTLYGILINIALVCAKVIVGVMGKSYALVADGIHSAVDLATDGLTLGALYFNKLPPDHAHPYGHKKIETLLEIGMGVVLAGVGFGIGLSSAKALYFHRDIVPAPTTIVVAVCSIIVKEWLFHYTHRVGDRLDSNALKINAWHHRSDALTSIAVCVGLVVIQFFPQLDAIDAILGVCVAFVIVKIGIEFCIDAIKRIIDTRPADEFVDGVQQIIENIPDVRAYHNLRMRYIGTEISIELHIEVDPDLKIAEGHEIARTVKWNIMNTYPMVYDVLIHVEPEENRIQEGSKI